MKYAMRLSPLFFALAACGPNYRYVYDGESAFERCYSLDYDDASTPPARQQCWAAWLQSYTFGAGADRVDYARAHASGQASQSLAAQTQQGPAETFMAPQQQEAPAAIDARMAPPSTTRPQSPATAWRREQISVGGNPVAAPPPTAPVASPETEPPGSSCGNDCHETWHTCGTRCTGNDAACVARCDDGYRDCMRGCF